MELISNTVQELRILKSKLYIQQQAEHSTLQWDIQNWVNLNQFQVKMKAKNYRQSILEVGEFHFLSFSFHCAADILYCQIGKSKQLKKKRFCKVRYLSPFSKLHTSILDIRDEGKECSLRGRSLLSHWSNSRPLYIKKCFHLCFLTRKSGACTNIIPLYSVSNTKIIFSTSLILYILSLILYLLILMCTQRFQDKNYDHLELDWI